MSTDTFRCFDGKAQPGDPFWVFRNAEETGGEAELEFYGVISEWSWLSDDITPKKFKDQLYKAGKGGPIRMRINSPGGDPIAASAISAIISAYPGKVTAQVEGQASSAAVMVALAANQVEIYDSAYMMIHDPSVNVFLASLSIETLTRLRDALKSIKKGLAQSYAARTGLATERVAGMMTKTTWMSAQEAVELGFADEVIEGGQGRPQKEFENILRQYADVPSALLNLAVDEPEEDDSEPEDESPEADEIEAEEPAEEPQAVPDGPEGEVMETEARITAPYAERLAKAADRIQPRKNRGESKGDIMYVRELENRRAMFLEEAQSLVNQADEEGRDLTEEERERFVAIMGDEDDNGEIYDLETQIERIYAEREKLRAAAEKQFKAGGEAVKPEPAKKTKMKRSEFEALSGGEQRAFLKDGGKVED